MNVEALLAQLKSVRRSREGWIARCPAHADRSPSLSVGVGRDARVLLYCHAGCTPQAVCAALGIGMGELFAGPGLQRKAEPRIVRDAQSQIAELRTRLSQRDRERPVTVVLANGTNLEAAVARAFALAVEGELVQVALEVEAQ